MIKLNYKQDKNKKPESVISNNVRNMLNCDEYVLLNNWNLAWWKIFVFSNTDIKKGAEADTVRRHFLESYFDSWSVW